MKDTLGDRMKDFYESRSKYKLSRRTNVMIRVDGKAFHTYTKGLKRPHDEGLAEDMDLTTKYLCENIQGAKMGYVQSDEISIWLTDYETIKTDAWFDFEIDKMCSIAASLATAKFNQLRMKRSCVSSDPFIGPTSLFPHDLDNFKLAMFDARAFALPTQDEVVNYFIWRQQDATRNSISMAAQALYSDNELKGRGSNEKQELMHAKGVNWNDYSYRFKRGGAIIKTSQNWVIKINPDTKKPIGKPTRLTASLYDQLGDPSTWKEYKFFTRSAWEAIETPIFTQDKDFILNQYKEEEL